MASVGQRVLVVERRAHLGGNAYDEHNDRGLLVHRYGPHIFHTNSPVVWNYLSRFTEWRLYEHRVLGSIQGQLVPIPFNLNSLSALFPGELASRIERGLVAECGFDKRIPILKLRESTQPELIELGEYVYRHVFEQYTIKQWGYRPEELDPGVTARVPILVSRDNRYFQDTYQAMPSRGYAAMFSRMLDHPNINILLNCDWKELTQEFSCAQILYTGEIDEFMSYRFGPLPYRSLRFDQCTLDISQYQPVGTINFPNSNEFTRITEQKHLTGQRSECTTIITEYPMLHEPGRTIAYYPIPRQENRLLHSKYVQAARKEFPNVVFGGRLADYQYYNMDQACARALKLASENNGPQWNGRTSETDILK